MSRLDLVRCGSMLTSFEIDLMGLVIFLHHRAEGDVWVNSIKILQLFAGYVGNMTAGCETRGREDCM